MTVAEDVLELARFAPSGDNAQPWRFKVRSPDEFDVYTYDTRAHCVYDLDGWASELAHGMLLETIAIAATRHGRQARIDPPADDAAAPARYRVVLSADGAVVPDPLLEAVASRTVQRRPMRMRRLTPPERSTLESAAAPLRIAWFEPLPARARIAALCARNARIRMTIPEAYATHRAVIAWHATVSDDRMPDMSLGAGPLVLALMRGAMTSWERVEQVNRWTGTLMPRIALDYLPGVRCSAQVALIADRAPASRADRVAAGRAVQRLWLTATALNLQMQPQYTPLVFARYARERRRFTVDARASVQATGIADELDRVLGHDCGRAVWLARIGPARSVSGRSLRLPLAKLIVGEAPPALAPLAPI